VALGMKRDRRGKKMHLFSRKKTDESEDVEGPGRAIVSGSATPPGDSLRANVYRINHDGFAQ